MRKQIVLIVTLSLVLILLTWGMWEAAGIGSANAGQDTLAVATVVFVNELSMPLANADIRVLCFTSGTPGAAATADVMVTTDAAGVPRTALPPDCPYLAALQLHHEQPSAHAEHGPAFWIYTTSWVPGSMTPLPASGNIEIKRDRPLVLFNVVTSLGWEMAPNSGYADDLRAGLRGASAYLYDLTEGKMALGPATIHENGRHWDTADIRVLPANDYRPSAFVGGIVPAPLPFSSGTGRHSVFAPANIFLGRYWDGLDAASGPWSHYDGYATIIHEWAHHALFLYDEYMSTSGFNQFCTCRGLPTLSGACGGLEEPGFAASVMAYQYTASEFWGDDFHLPYTDPNVCTTTPQWAMHGVDDWKTLDQWHTILGLTLPPWLHPVAKPAALSFGPNAPGIAGELFGRTPGHSQFLPAISGGTVIAAEPYTLTLDVFLSAAGIVAAPLPTEVYLLKDSFSGNPTHILHQGQVVGTPVPGMGKLGEIALWGVTPDDQARVYVDRYATASAPGRRYMFPAPGSADSSLDPPVTAVQANLDPWAYNLDWDQGLTAGQLTTLTVKLDSLSHTLSGNTVAQLCGLDEQVGCDSSWQSVLDPIAGTDVWTAEFTPLPGETTLPAFGILRIAEPGLGEINRWYQQLGGIGPGHIDADAPLRDGTVMVDSMSNPPAPTDCNHVLVTPATDANALTTSLGQDGQGVDIVGLLGTPLDVDVLLANGGACVSSGLDHALPISIMVTLFYSEADINQLGIREIDLRLLHFSRGQGTWSQVFTNGADPDLNRLSSIPVLEDGIYAVGYVASP